VLLNEREATPADHRAFGEWVARSPERVEAYLQAAQLTLALRLPGADWPDTPVDELIRAAKAAPNQISSLATARRHDGRETADPQPVCARAFTLRMCTRVATVAAVALAVLVASLWIYLSPQRVNTSVGEQRSVILADGSLVTLNTSSSIEVHMAKRHRLVKLLAGEALFQVAHDASRPFDVTTGDTIVRAVGTQFDVDRRAASTTVTVVEGRVAVLTAANGNQTPAEARLPLEAGEQLTLIPRTARRLVRTDVSTAIAWTQRKLIFEHRLLGEVADEFNRYNRQIIEIQSAELRNQEITGVFEANDPDSFLTFLSRLPGVTIERSADHSRFVVKQTVHDSSL
jgi:transmembrane sensor